MDIYLIFKGKTLHFPVNPESIRVNNKKSYETHDIIFKGEKDWLHKDAKRIQTVSFNALFPKEEGSYCRYSGIPSPDKCVSIIQEIINSDEFARLIITDFKINGLVNLTENDVEMNTRYNGDKVAALDFRVVTGTPSNAGKKTIEREGNTTNLPQLKDNRPDDPKPANYTVKRSDNSSYKVAKRATGNGANYKAVEKANNTKTFKTGDKVVIPQSGPLKREAVINEVLKTPMSTQLENYIKGNSGKKTKPRPKSRGAGSSKSITISVQ